MCANQNYIYQTEIYALIQFYSSGHIHYLYSVRMPEKKMSKVW